MKKLNGFLLLIAIGLMAISCSDNDKTGKSSEEKAIADSLEHDVDEVHMEGMRKAPGLGKAREEANRILDSISMLPAKAKESLKGYQARLDSLVKDLEYADFAMTKWMEEYNYDSALNNLEARIKYLGEEKLKASKVKDAINNSLQRADSIFRSKFQ